MKTLVVGGAGFLGSHLVERLLADGHSVDVVDDLSTGSLANLSSARSLGGDLKIHTLDAVADEFPALVSMRSPEIVYHLGWSAASGEITARGAARCVHSMLNALEAARRIGNTKIVTAVPAVSLYGQVGAKDLPVKEGQPWSPVGVRGVVARTMIDLLGVYRTDHEVEFTVLALANVYGPRQLPDGGVVAAFADALAHRRAPEFHGDGRQTRDFLYVDDAIDAFVRAADHGGGLVVNVGTGSATSVRDLWSLMAAPDSPQPNMTARRVGDVDRFCVAPSRARIHLAWAPWTPLANGVRLLH